MTPKSYETRFAAGLQCFAMGFWLWCLMPMTPLGAQENSKENPQALDRSLYVPGKPVPLTVSKEDGTGRIGFLFVKWKEAVYDVFVSRDGGRTWERRFRNIYGEGPKGRSRWIRYWIDPKHGDFSGSRSILVKVVLVRWIDFVN